MKDILNRPVKVGDLVMMVDYNRPVFVIISHVSRAGNLMAKWYCSAASYERHEGKFHGCTYIIGPLKQVVLVPLNSVPNEIMDDYLRIIEHPDFNKKR